MPPTGVTKVYLETSYFFRRVVNGIPMLHFGRKSRTFLHKNAEWEFLLPFIHQPEIDPPLSLGMLGAAAVINLFVTKFFKYLYCYSQVIAAR